MSDIEREARAARNQSVFRAVNEKIRDINVSFAALTEEFTIACECADVTCVETLSIRPADYAEVRANPRRFAVLPGHVYPDVEDVVAEADGYLVVEKAGHGAEVAESLRSDE